ncbi:MAG TPA: GTP 3',8-cyclase MoaA [Candidatus Glassbacteria bacterium]|nr:GTP 3',8-cyclase MoaA [Candidatus Glassbacteria bacterium]
MAEPLPRLVDTFGRAHDYLRVSVTDRCNLRCSYCRPAGTEYTCGSKSRLLEFAEIERLVAIFARLGVRKVRLTGGEPLARAGIEELIQRLVRLSGIETVVMTTNGVLLAEKAVQLKAAGLAGLNVSLDTLRDERFQQITGSGAFYRVLGGIQVAKAAGFVPLKINSVVMRGVNDDELEDFVELARFAPLHVRFIEFMPYGANGWNREAFISWSEMKESIECHYRLAPAGGEGNSADVAREFTVEGFCGRIGFITPLTGKFCGDCTRLRLTSDGGFKPCLHNPDEIDLATPLRSGADDSRIAGLILESLKSKQYAHQALTGYPGAVVRSMVETGG